MCEKRQCNFFFKRLSNAFCTWYIKKCHKESCIFNISGPELIGFVLVRKKKKPMVTRHRYSTFGYINKYTKFRQIYIHIYKFIYHAINH